MIYADLLIAPAGIISFLFFAAATITGFKRFRLLRYHRKAGYLCMLFVLIHLLLAVSADFYEITGLLAGFFMVLTVVSGIVFKRRFRLHLILTIITAVVSAGHVFLNLYFG